MGKLPNYINSEIFFFKYSVIAFHIKLQNYQIDTDSKENVFIKLKLKKKIINLKDQILYNWKSI